MGIVDVKTAVDMLALSSDIRKKVDDIVGAATARGGMTPEEREQLMHILELESELAEIEVSALEGALKALGDYDKEVDTALETAMVELEEAGK